MAENVNNLSSADFLALQKKKQSATGQSSRDFLIARGVIKPDLSTPEGMEAAIRAAGMNPPVPVTPLSALKRTAGVLNVGTAATSGFAKGLLTGQNPLTTAKESIAGSASGKDITGFSDTYREAFGAPTSRLGKVGVATGGFIADVIFDPLTYLTFGLGAGLKIPGVAGKVLSKGGTELFQDVATQATKKFGQKGTKEAELLFSQALGKKGITDEALQGLLAKGWDEQTIKTVASEAPNLIDRGGIKFAGKTILSTDAIANSPIGKAVKAISETEAVKNLREALGKTFVPDFMKNPKIEQIISRGGREIQKAFEGILEANQKLFKGLSEEQMARLFTSIWDKKKTVAKSGELVEGIAKNMDQAAWLKKGIQNPYDEAGGLTAKARQALEGEAKRESKRILQSEKIVFDDDEALQKVSDALFEPKVVEKKLADGSVTKEVEPSIMAKYAKLAGIPEEDAIKFYIPSKFEEFLNKKSSVSPSGVSSAKGNFLKEFKGVEREDQIKDPFELFTRGQIEIVTDRIKTDMAKAVVRELGIPLSQMTEEMAKRIGYVKFERKALATVKETINRSEAIKTLKEIKTSFNKTVREIKGTIKTDKEVSRTIKSIEDTIEALNKKTAKELSSFFSEGTVSEVTSKAVSRTRTIPENLRALENEVRSTEKYKPSIALEKAYEDGDLQRAGFKSIDDFIETAKTPFSSKPETTGLKVEVGGETKIKNAAGLQKQVTRLKEKLTTAAEIQKPSVTDAIDNLSRQIEDMIITKTNIRQSGIANAPKVTGWIPKAVNDEITKFYEPKMNAIDDLAKSIGFDYATGLFKGYVTSLFPSFHIRNITSNVFQNMLKIGVDALNPSLHSDAASIVLGRNLDKQITTKTGKVMTLGQVRDLIKKDSDIFNTGAFGKMENFIEEARDIAMRGPGKNRFNPLSRENLALQGGRKLGTLAEQEAKLVNVLSNIMQGKSVQEGIKSAEEALFNYSKLTEFERSVMRRIIPFYTFARKNAELQVKALAKTPGVVAAELKGIKALGESIGEPVTEEDIKGLPSYVLNSLGIKAGVNEYGQNTFITGFGLPIEEFLGRFSGDKGIISNVVSNLMTQMNPTLKYPAELATERDFFRGRPITEINNADQLKPFLDVLPKPVAEEFKKALNFREIPGQAVYVNGVKTGTKTKYVANPFALHFMRNLFTARIQSTVGFLSSEDETNWNKLLKLFTGVKGWSIDQEQQKFYKDLERSRELQDFMLQMGLAKKFESLYTPKKKPFEDIVNANQ